MIPAPINDQQAIECLGVVLAPITNGKMDTPVQVHCGVLLIDYGTQKLLTGGAAPPTTQIADKAQFHASLAAAHAKADVSKVDWPSLIQELIQLVIAVGPIVGPVLSGS
jgi:hypothetical protein